MLKISLLTISVLLLLAGCGPRSSNNSQAPQSNAYFDVFMREHAVKAENLPRPGVGTLGIGKSVIDGTEIGEVLNIFADGRVLVRFSSGVERIVTSPSPEKNGTNGLYAGYLALTAAGEVCTVKQVFANGFADVSFSSGVTRVVSGLIPEMLGNYSGYYVIADGSLAVVRTVFVDGRAEVRFENGTEAVRGNLIPEKNGTSGLVAGESAIDPHNNVVLLLNVFADGRAYVRYSSGTTALVGGLVPASK